MARGSSATSKSDLEGMAKARAYLASVPVEQRAALLQLRKAIAAAAPGAEEGISYGLPAFRLDGRPLVCYSAAETHCSFFPMSPAVIRAHARALEPYDTSKGTIRFTADNTLPATLVRKLVRGRIAELTKDKK